jgi:hypothetical protein
MLVRTRDGAATERWEDRDSDREVASLALRGRAPRMLRAVGLMIAGGAAAAVLTAYLMRTENVQSMQTTTDMAALPQLPTIVAPPLGAAAPNAAANAAATPMSAGAAPPAEVKFTDKDAVVVPAASAVPQSVAAPQAPAPLAAAESTPHHHAHPKPKSTSNALMPDNNDALQKDLAKPLPASPGSGGGPKDPVAEAQLRASMR